jgi:hypothetical protein
LKPLPRRPGDAIGKRNDDEIYRQLRRMVGEGRRMHA